MPTLTFPDGLTPTTARLDGAVPETATARAARADARLVRRLGVRLTTPTGSLPFARSLGLPVGVVDAPASAVPLLRLAVAAALRPERAVALRAVRVETGPHGRTAVAVHLDRA